MNLNKVNNVSKYGAIILFIGVVPALAFYCGIQYAKVQKLYEDLAHVEETYARENALINFYISSSEGASYTLPINTGGEGTIGAPSVQ